jgi:outer membrane receptor protein involved in Fe transport
MMAALLISLLTIASPAQDTLLQAATVTALKESVSLEKIPSPVSVIRKDRLQRSGTYRPNSLSSLVPGLHIPDYGASLTSTIYLRGLGSRMENPVMGLYLDGIPVLDKNAYDFDWEGLRSATMLRGPQGTLYGRNAMGGVLSLQSLSLHDKPAPVLHLEYGSAATLRTGAVAAWGNHVFSATYRHTNGYFPNEYQEQNCDPYDGLSAHWKWERPLNDRLWMGHSAWVSLSREGGFAYGPWKDGQLGPVSYNDEGSYRRLSVIEGLQARWQGQEFTADATTSIQLLADDMRMDQDYTPASVFTLQQRQRSGAGTLEVRFRRRDVTASWQPQTGIFALYKRNHLTAPVTFKQDGIQRLILDNANSHIPADIGYLAISDQTIPVDSDFHIGSWNAALFHESVFTTGRWQFTAGLRLDYEGGRMDYDCLASLHYRFVPTMSADKTFSAPYRGSRHHAVFEVLPKLSVLFEASAPLSLYATLSKGYRAGGFNTQIFSDILQNETMNGLMQDLGVYLERPLVSVSADHTEYDPETAWNGELGARLRKGALRAEASAYYIAVRNQQLTVFPPGMSTGRMMTNAGRSRSLGTEAELSWTPGDFRAQACWGWCDARFVRYHDGNQDYAGKHIPYVPQHTLYLGLGYRFRFDGCRLDLDLDSKGEGPFWWNEDNTLREPFRIRLGGRLALVFPRWEIYLRGENLSNTQGRSFYFKSIGNEFFASIKPRILLTGLSIKL